jgi:hypothetical protein
VEEWETVDRLMELESATRLALANR